jgi:hypothetical protein
MPADKAVQLERVMSGRFTDTEFVRVDLSLTVLPRLIEVLNG